MIFKGIILSFIQALTEFLPISSSGHLLIFKHLLNIPDLPVSFDIAIHTGSLIAIFIFFRKKLLFDLKDSIIEIKEKKEFQKTKFFVYIIISTFITFIIFILLKKFFENLFNNSKYLFISYCFTSIVLFLTYFTSYYKNKINIYKSNIFVSIIAGLFQSIAIIPGVSRSGSTISSLLFLKINDEDAYYYSFILAIPAIAGALLLSFLDMDSYSFYKSHLLMILTSFFTTIVLSLIALKILQFIIKKKKLWIFGFYTLFLTIFSFFNFH